MSETVKRYLISTAITFVAGFAIALIPSLDNITLENIGTGALAGVVFAALRAGLKAVLEGFVSWYKAR